MALSVNNFEKFTNADYKDLTELDLRSCRYKKRLEKSDSKSALMSESDSENPNKEHSALDLEPENTIKAPN